MKQVESFFWGIIAALGALVVELIIFIGFSSSIGTLAQVSFEQLFIIPQFIIAGVFIEEAFKYIIISKRIEMISMRRSYIINSLLVGLGFFSIELGLILTTGIIPETKLLAEIALVHVGTAGLIGYIVATSNPAKLSTFIHAMIITVFLHSSYNLLVLKRTFMINYVVLALIGVLVLANFANIIRINRKLAQD